MSMSPEDTLLPLLGGVVEKAPGEWMALCPCHDDHSPSLSIKKSDRGGLLLYCFVCKDKEIDRAICQTLGIKLSAICPPRDPMPTTLTKPSPRGVPALYEGKSLVKTYEYHNADGSPNKLVARYESGAGDERKKTFLQFQPNGSGGWVAGVKGVPEVPYRLRELLASSVDEIVFVVEGEKCVHALVGLGLVATTNAGGGGKWPTEFREHFYNRDVVVLPDNDKPGADHAIKVVRSLREACRLLHQVRLPGLGEKEDCADWIARGGTRAELLRIVREQTNQRPQIAATDEPAAEAAPAVATKPARLEPWKPFPTGALPEPLRTFIDDSARAIGCDPAYVGLPVLVAATSAIGLTYSLRMKNNWFVKPILWGCVVGKSGTAKTPAFDAAMAFTRERQTEAREHHAAAMGQWQKDLDQFNAEHDKWESDGGGEDDEPQKPPRPVLERVMTTNITVEALASILDSTPKGLLVAVDELSGLIAGFDRYAAGKGGDAPQWLSCYNAGPIVIDRKTGEPRTLYVPRAAVSICGTTQPATLSRVMGREHRDSGLLARFLLVAPPSEPAVWSDADVSEATLAATRELFQRLFDQAPAADEFGKPTPNLVHKSAEAHREWVRFFNRHNERIAELDDEDLRASFKKLEEVAARIALVVHVVRQVSDDGVADPTHIDGDSMRAGITLAEWFVGETRRVYQIVGGESPAVSIRRRTLDWLAKQSGQVTLRHVQKSCRWLREPGAAETALAELAGSGLGEWKDQPAGPRGGRPTRVFILSALPKPETSPTGFGYADTGDSAGEAPEDWGAN